MGFRTVAFGDPGGRLWGAAVDAGPAAVVLGSADGAVSAAGPSLQWTVEGRDWTLSSSGFELHVEPRGEPPEDHDGNAEPEVTGLQELCRVHGRISLDGDQLTVDCPGTRSEIDGLPAGTLGSARGVSGWFDEDEAITALALRSRHAPDHDADMVAATLFDPDGWVSVADPRLSTTYTEAGDPVRTSLELWVGDGENEFPRRVAGEAAGPATAVTDGELLLRVAPLSCHSRGREGAGVYVLATL